MAISSAYLPVKLSGDGVTVAFSFDFRIYENTDLKVSWILKTTGEVSAVKVLSTDYTVAINANSEGGIVTFGSGDIPPSTVWVLIESVIPKTQSTRLGIDSKLSEQSIERMADRQCRLIQQAAEAIDRSLKIPPSLASAGIDMSIPIPVAGKVLGFNADGDGFELYEADSGVAAAEAEAAQASAEAAQTAAEAAQTGAETAQTGSETAQGLAEDAQAAAEAAQAAAEAAAATDPFATKLLHVRDEKSAGTAGGNSASSAFVKRTLNTVVTNEISGAGLASDQITLPAGTYYVDGDAPASGNIDGTVCKLVNVTDVADTLLGRPVYTVSPGIRSPISGRFTIAAQKVFELQHFVASGGTYGQAANRGIVEIYADLRIWKVA